MDNTCYRTPTPSVNKDIFDEKILDLVQRNAVNNFMHLLTEQKYKQVIGELKTSIQKKAENKKLSSLDYRRLNRFELINIGGVDKLIEKRNDDAAIKYYCSTAELHEILEKAHHDTGHKRTLGMEKEIIKKYCNVTRSVIEEYLKLCTQCQLKKKLKKKGLVAKPIISTAFNKRGQVDLVDMQTEKDGEFKFILNYQDNLTKFVFLRPLKSKRAEEVAYQLMDIFCIVGAPCLLHSDNGKEFANAIISNLAEIYEAKIIHGKPRHSESQGSVERANQDIKDILIIWMQENNSKNWSQGLRFVQLKKNRSFHSGIQRTPYEAMFGTPMVNGLKDSNLPLDIIAQLQNEEDLTHLINKTNEEIGQTNNIQEEVAEQDIEDHDIMEQLIEDESEEVGQPIPMEQEQNTSTVLLPKISNHSDHPHNQDKEDEADIVSQVEDRISLINQNRSQSVEALKRQSKKMLDRSAKRFPPVKVGQNVLLKIPDVDRGRAAPRNVMAIVLKENDGLYELGTSTGMLDKLYSRNEF